MNRRFLPAILLLMLVAAVVGGRVILLYWSEFVYDEEEYKTGSIAYLIMEGPQLPLLEYQPGDYEGGTLFFGLLTIPFFFLFGQNYLALKLVALLTTLITALAATLYARRHGGPAAAIATGALFILPPVVMLQIGLLPWGNYAENAMLSLVMLLAASHLYATARPSLWKHALFGFGLGFGVWIHYGFLVTVVWLAILGWLARPRGMGGRQILAMLTGALGGFTPWIAYNATHHWWGLGRFGDALRGPGHPGARLIAGAGRLWGLLTVDLPAGLHFRAASVTTIKIFAYLYCFLLLLLLALLLRLLWKKAGAMLHALWPTANRAVPDAAFWSLAPAGFLLLYTLVFVFSGYGLFGREWGSMDAENHAHIFALYPFGLLVAGLAVGAAWPTRWRGPAAVAVAGLVVLGAVGFRGMLTPDRPQAERLSRDAYDRGVIYLEIGSKWGADAERVQQLQQKLEGQALRYFVYGAGLRYGLDHPGDLSAALAKCAEQPENLRPYCWVGIGFGFYVPTPLPLPEAEVDALLKWAPAHLRPWLIVGACVGNTARGAGAHWSCDEAPAVDIRAIAPPGQEEELASFVAGQLAMGEFRPGKE